MNRRRFLTRTAAALSCGVHAFPPSTARGLQAATAPAEMETPMSPDAMTLFLCGDVMTGRGIDQILPHPSKPQLYESYMRSAAGYVELAERASGAIRRPVGYSYIWGDALAEFDRRQPDVRIVNLETSVTVSEDAAPRKGIHYRMHPANVACLGAARFDCCSLANNHVLDWGRKGLVETLDTLRGAGIRTAGAGRDEQEATAPAVLEVPGKGRVLVFAVCTQDSGVPSIQYRRVGEGVDGVDLDDIAPHGEHPAPAQRDQIGAHRRPGGEHAAYGCGELNSRWLDG